jgi:soluble lytic murein transglycosylase
MLSLTFSLQKQHGKTMPNRFHRVYRALSYALAAATLVACGTASAVRSTPSSRPLSDDQIFVQLREAARNNDPARAAQLASMIPDYPAPSYIEYFQIKPQLFDSSGHARIDAPDRPVLSFLQRYDGTAIADRLRNDYLTVLGARHDWRNFDAQYARFVLNDDTQVKCYALESKMSRGENVAEGGGGGGGGGPGVGGGGALF